MTEIIRASATSALRGIVPTPIFDQLFREFQRDLAKAYHPATASKAVA